MSRKAFIILPFIFFILYSVLFPAKSGTDYYFDSINVVDSMPSEAKYDKIFPFIYNDIFGYVSDNGYIVYQEKADDFITANNKYFIDKSNNCYIIKDWFGEKVALLSSDLGMPEFTSELLFVTENNEKTLSQIDITGNILGQYSSLAEITDFDSSDSVIMVGFADGNVVIANKGENNFKKLDYQINSKFQIVYNCAVSDDSKYLALKAGAEPEYILLFQKKADDFKLVRQYEVSDNIRGKSFMKFSDFSLFFQEENGISSVNPVSMKRNRFLFQGAPEEVSFSGKNDFIFVISKDKEDKKVLTAFFQDGRKLFSLDYIGDSAYISQHRNSIITGFHNNLIYCRISKK